MSVFTKEARDELNALVARAKEIKARAKAPAARRLSAEKKTRDKAVQHDAGQRDPRQHDDGFQRWIHDWECIACLIEGGPGGPIEAAHQKLAIAGKGWREGGLGPRVHDTRCVPLCAHHHREDRNSCDLGGQRKFWDRLGLGDLIADFCRDMHAAFKADASGADVIAKYVRIALTNLSEDGSVVWKVTA